jgi:hypothetical protein
MNSWDVLEQEFRKSFIDYAANECAFKELRKLKMKDGKVDEYIAEFRRLVHRAGLDENDGNNICMFAQGLPGKLADTVIDTSCPQTFEEWAPPKKCTVATTCLHSWILGKSRHVHV